MHLRAGNIGPQLSYTRGYAEPLPLQVAAAGALFPLGFREDLCATFEPRIGIGASKLADEPLLLGVSAAGKLFRFLSLRTGYEFPYGGEPGRAGLCAGVGLERHFYGADVGWKNQSEEFGSVWSLSVSVRLKEAVAKKAEDYYFLARRYFGEGRLRQSLGNAKKAVELDPNMWKAHTLISEINALKRRASGTEIAVIYTGNAQGKFAPQPAGSGMSGGFARQAAVIRGLREQFPVTVTIDAGNSLGRTSLDEKSAFADWFYDHCVYDARGLGKGELDFGLGRIFIKSRKATCPFLCSNMAGSYGTNIAGKKTMTSGGYSFALLATTGPAVASAEEDRKKLLPCAEELTGLLSKGAAKGADVRILISNDSWERTRALAEAFPQIDIILCGGIGQRFETPMRVGNALIISPGQGGCCVGKLILRFNKDKKIISFDNHLIALTEDIPPDPVVAGKLPALAEGAQAAENVAAGFGAGPGDASGVFAFVSDRDTVNGIYLKVLDKLAEFPLTAGRGSASKPLLSFACGKCAYFEKQSDTACPVLRVMDLSGVNKRTVPFDGCVSEACFTPDGKWLYLSAAAQSASGDIYRIKPQGGGALPVIAWKNSSEGSMAFSSDGAFMAFTSDAGGGRQLYLADSGGNKPLCLTEGKTDNFSPHFCPTGRYLAFLSDKTSFGGSYDLWLHDTASGAVYQLTTRSAVNDFCWLPDGKSIVYSAGRPRSALRTMSVGGAESSELIGAVLQKDYSELAPRVMPWRASVRIIYTRELRNGDREIYWVRPDGTGDERVVKSRGGDWLE
jgi:Tol biopolymer transport system component